MNDAGDFIIKLEPPVPVDYMPQVGEEGAQADFRRLPPRTAKLDNKRSVF